MTWKKVLMRIKPSLYSHVRNWGWGVALTLLLIGGYVLLQPKVAARVIPTHHQRSINRLLTEFSSTGQIDPRFFWQWRELHSPGYLTVNEHDVSFGETQYITRVASPSSVLITYHSPLVTSTDSVVISALIDVAGGYFDRTAVVGKPVVFLEDKRQVFFADEQTLVVQFVQPISVMKQTIGVFNFTAEEEQLLSNYVWVHRSEIRLPESFVLPPVL